MATTQVKTDLIEDGAVTSAKLDTNIAIDGNLTVDTNTLYVDSTNNRVGIGITPSTELHIFSANPNIKLQSSGASTTTQIDMLARDVSNVAYMVNIKATDTSLTLASGGNPGNSYVPTERMRIKAGGDISFRDTSANEAFYWDASAARLGIGTGSSPSANLDIVGTAKIGPNRQAIFSESNGNNSSFIFSSSGNMEFRGTGTDYNQLFLKSGGNVGIGTASPATKLHISDTAAVFTTTSTNGVSGFIQNVIGGATALYRLQNDSSEKMRVTGGGNVLIGTTVDYSRLTVSNENSARTGITISDTNTSSLMLFAGNSSDAVIAIDTYNLAFKTGATAGQDNGTTRMLIQQGGNVGIGTDIISASSFSSSTKILEVAHNNAAILSLINTANIRHQIISDASGSLTFWDDSNNQTRLTINSSGNVGIGTDSPDSQLQIVNSSGGSYRLGYAGSNVYFDADAFYVRAGNGNSNKMVINSSGNVGIGTTSPSQKLSVRDDNTSAYPITLENFNIGAPGVHTGIRFGYINNTYQKGAIIFESQDSSGRGKMFFAMEGTANSANADETDAKMTIDYSGNVGIGTTSPAEKLHVVGNIKATGDVVADCSSDERLKDNINVINNPIDKIKKIKGVEFDWNDKQSTYEGHDIGVIAQDIEKVLPELVSTRDNGYKAVKYDKLTALLIEAVKQQQEQIEKLEKLILKQ